MASFQEWLALQLAASTAPIQQLCVQDHTTSATPHIHMMAHFTDGETTAWFSFNDATVAELREELTAVRSRVGAAAPAVRIHLHGESEKKAEVAEPAVVSALPGRLLTAREATLLSTDGAGSCVICMEEYVSGDEVAILPCLHKAHRSCIAHWLERAATCPSCRYALPTTNLSASAMANLLEPAVRELSRLVRVEPAPCQRVDEELEPATRPPTAAGLDAEASPHPGMAWVTAPASTRSPASIRSPGAIASQPSVDVPQSPIEVLATPARSKKGLFRSLTVRFRVPGTKSRRARGGAVVVAPQ